MKINPKYDLKSGMGFQRKSDQFQVRKKYRFITILILTLCINKYGLREMVLKVWSPNQQ